MPWHSCTRPVTVALCLQVAATPLFAAAAELYGREDGALRGVVAPEEVGEGGARGQQWGGRAAWWERERGAGCQLPAFWSGVCTRTAFIRE